MRPPIIDADQARAHHLEHNLQRHPFICSGKL